MSTKFHGITINQIEEQVRMNQLLFGLDSIKRTGLVIIPTTNSSNLALLFNDDNNVIKQEFTLNGITLTLDNQYSESISIIGREVSYFSEKKNLLFFKSNLTEIEKVEINSIIKCGETLEFYRSNEKSDKVFRAISQVKTNWYYEKGIIDSMNFVLELTDRDLFKYYYLKYNIKDSTLTVSNSFVLDTNFYSSLLNEIENCLNSLDSRHFDDCDILLYKLRLPNPEAIIYPHTSEYRLTE